MAYGERKQAAGVRATKADLARFMKLHELGCIACRKAGSGYRAPDIHHVLRGGRRIGHQATLPLCPEHHRFPSNGTVVGPSLADGSKVFAAKFGTQQELLTEVNNLLD
jgi:hypothetical protein